MAQYIDKNKVEDILRKLWKEDDGHNSEHRICYNKALQEVQCELDTLEVKDPYEQCVQYPSIKDGIEAHASIYSFNIESQLFPQLTKEQQTLWRKEIEQACISGGDAGVTLARDQRYKENVEMKETELKGIEKEVAEGHVGLVDKKRVPIELKGELKAKFKNEFNTLWQIVNGIQFANVAKHIVERICLNFAIWGAYNLKIGQRELTEIKDESEDETVRKYFIAKFKKMLEEDNLQPLGTVDASNLLAWLEKQEEKKPLYIRFGDVPSNEISKIHRGEVEIGEDFELNGNVVLGLTLPITKTTLYTQQHLLEYDNRPCYLVSGDYVGKGTDGEPLIRNISIIKRLDNYRVKEKKQGKQETLCDKCRKEHPSHSCQDITELGRCAVEHEQKLADKIKPKFHEGDWIVFNGLVLLINEIVQGYYRTISIGGIHNSYDWDIDNVARLWTIKDAKDGDVLMSRAPFIYGECCPYGGLDWYKGKFIIASNYIFTDSPVHPATKEQRDTLMKAMADARYTFDFEKKDNKTCKENGDSLTDDERIKGEIIDFIYDKTDTYELREKSNSWLTWLEKQGIKPLGQVEDKTELAETEDNKVITDWSEEDEYLLGETIQHLEELIRIDKAKHCACDVQYYQRDIDWLKSLKERAVWKQRNYNYERK